MLAALPQMATAQKNDTSKVQTSDLNDIIIQDSRIQIPFSDLNRDITVISSKEIQSLPVHSLNEILSYVAGVDIRQRSPWGGQADISVNGGTFDETLVLLNGVKIIDPQTGHNMLNLPISPDAIERIEILKGAAASAYGINALNGVINIVTKQPAQTGVSVNLTAGSSFEKDTSNQHLYGAIGADITASLATKNVKHFLSLSTQQTSGYRYNTAMNNNKIFYQNQINLGNENRLSFMGGYVNNDFGANGFYAPPADVESKETAQTGIAALNGDFLVKDGWHIRPSVSYRYNHDNYIFVRQDPSIYENNHFTNVLDATLNNSIATANGELGLGLEFRNEAINSNSLGDWQRSDFGLYAEYSFKKIKNTTIDVGAYLNYSRYFGWKLLPSLDAGYHLNPHWRLFMNAGTGTRVPTYTDWYYRGPANIGNSNLKPENAFYAEAGLKYNKGNLLGSLSYFYQVTSDFIDWTKDSLTGPWQPQNFQQIKTPGINFSVKYQLLQPQSNKGVNILAGLSYTWLNPVIDKKEEQQYPFSHYALENLRNQLVGNVTARFWERWSATLTGRYEQRVSYKDYFIVDARLAGTFGSFQASIDLNNLTNVTYIEAGAYPMPGRWISIGLGWNFLKKGKDSVTL